MAEESPGDMQHTRIKVDGWPRTPRWAVVTTALLLGGILFYLLRGALMPFALGLAVAYLLDPVADKLEAVGLPRYLATLILLLTFFGFMVLAVLTLVPLLGPQLQDLVRELPGYVRRASEMVSPVIERVSDAVNGGNPDGLKEAATGYADVAAGWLLDLVKSVWSGGMALVDLISLLVITPVVAFYMLRDFDPAVAKIADLVPRPYAPKVRQIAIESDTVLGRFVRGQGAVALLLACFYAIALSIAGLNFGLAIGIVAGILNIVPFVGSIVGFVLATCVALAQYDSKVMWLVIPSIFIFGQFVEGNFITPRLIGDAVGLHPVWIIFALLAGGSLFGVTGVMLAVPAAAVLGVVCRHWFAHYKRSRLYVGDHAQLYDQDGVPQPLKDNDL